MSPPIRPNIVALTWDQIIARGAPRTASEPEAYRDVLYDTQTYVDNATVNLTFFATLQTDKTLGNMPQAGALPAATAFVISAFSSEWLFAGASNPGAGGVATLNDLLLLLNDGRPALTLTISDKTYGPWPLAYAGAFGFPTFFGYGTTTADTLAGVVAQPAPNGGFFIGNGLFLLPNVQFQAVAVWSAAQNISGNRLVRLSAHGTRYRRVT